MRCGTQNRNAEGDYEASDDRLGEMERRGVDLHFDFEIR